MQCEKYIDFRRTKRKIGHAVLLSFQNYKWKTENMTFKISLHFFRCFTLFLFGAVGIKWIMVYRFWTHKTVKSINIFSNLFNYLFCYVVDLKLYRLRLAQVSWENSVYAEQSKVFEDAFLKIVFFFVRLGQPRANHCTVSIALCSVLSGRALSLLNLRQLTY